MAAKDKRSIASKIKSAAKQAVVQTAKDVINFAPMAAGARVGAVAGKAVNRAIAKEAGKDVLKSANKAKGSGKMVVKEPAKGKTMSTAAKRDVVVKTDKKVIPVKRLEYISKDGKKSIKVKTKNPTVRVIEKEVTAKTAANRTAASNRLRYGAAKAETSRAKKAIEASTLLPRLGAAGGAAAGTAPAVSKKANKKKK
jgi:uncharacterized protein YcfJ